jgi:hypothetical protein
MEWRKKPTQSSDTVTKVRFDSFRYNESGCENSFTINDRPSTFPADNIKRESQRYFINSFRVSQKQEAGDMFGRRLVGKET